MCPVCPICKREVETRNNSSRPFCSERCKMIDLSHWLAGRYRISALAAEPLDEAGETVLPDRSAEADIE
ncbi:MAG: DNA gyrase inhibitor YacG [Terriglobia bacterium]